MLFFMKKTMNTAGKCVEDLYAEKTRFHKLK